MDVTIQVIVYDENDEGRAPFRLLIPSHRQPKLGAETLFLNNGSVVTARKTYWPEYHTCIKTQEDYDDLRDYLRMQALPQELIDLITTMICALGHVAVQGTHGFSSYLYLDEDKDAVQYQVFVWKGG